MGSDGSINKSNFTDLFNVLDGNQLKADTVLMGSEMYNRLLLWPASNAGDSYGTEVTINGYTYSTLFGRKLIVSNKSDIIADKEMYAFAAQEYLGKFQKLCFFLFQGLSCFLKWFLLLCSYPV